MKIVEIMSDCFDIYPFEGESTTVMVHRGAVYLPQIAYMDTDKARLYGEAILHAAEMSRKLKEKT